MVAAGLLDVLGGGFLAGRGGPGGKVSRCSTTAAGGGYTSNMKVAPTTKNWMRSTWNWPLLVVVAPLAAQVIGWGLADRYSYLKWDNFEVLSPWLWEAHGQLLSGQFPHWNQHQMFGEPLHAKGQAGACYLPYTLCQMICRTTGLGPGAYCGVIVFAHLPAAALGYYLLLRRLGARPFWSVLGSLGTVSGGYLTAITTLWVFSFPLATLFPWGCLAALWMLESDSMQAVRIAGTGGLLAAIAAVGHPQMTVYYWLAIALLAVGWACWVHDWPLRLGRMALALLLAGLLASPVILPMYELQFLSNRGQAYGLEEFSNRGVRPMELAGIFLPTLAVDSEALPAKYTVLAYQGFWVAASLVGLSALALKAVLPRRKGESDARIAAHPENEQLLRSITLFLVLAGIFVLFALGRHGLVYGWTRVVPVWSSFRWPFKFLGLAMPPPRSWPPWEASTSRDAEPHGSQSGRRCEPGDRRRRLPRIWLAGRLHAGRYAGDTDQRCVGTPLALLDTRWRRRTVLVLGIVSCGATIALAHDSEAKFFDETYASVGPDELGIDPDYRVVPLSEPIGPELRPVAYQEQGLLHSATMNGYDSATGIYAALYDRRMDDWMPAYVWGCPPPSFVPKLIASNFLRAANVRYCIVVKEDRALVELLDSQAGYARVKELAHTVVYANNDALPRAYFATRAEPFSPRAAIEGLFENRSALRTAFLEGLDQARDFADAAVESIQWDPAGLRATVVAPEGGLLVVSVKSYPGWRAWVDGRESEPVAANGIFQAVWIPAGAREVVLRFKPAIFGVALRAASGGLIAMLVWIAMQQRSRQMKDDLRGAKPAGRKRLQN